MTFNSHTDFFKACATALQNSQSENEIAFEVAELLAALGYNNKDESNGDCADGLQKSNHVLLLNIASQVEAVIQFESDTSPGATIIGMSVKAGEPGAQRTYFASGCSVDFRGAFERCVGEVAEILSFTEQPDDPLLLKNKGFVNVRGRSRDWCAAGLGVPIEQISSFVSWVEAKSLMNGRKEYFPADLAIRRVPNLREVQNVLLSNGVAAGITIENATLSAALELVERDACYLWWFGQTEGVKLDRSVSHSSEFRKFAARVRRNSDLRKIWYLDISSNIGIATVGAFSMAPENKSIISGFASHPNPHIAIEKAFLEMCQMELAQKLSLQKQKLSGQENLTEEDVVWIERYNSLTYDEYPQFRGKCEGRLYTECDDPSPLDFTIRMLNEQKFEAFALDLTRESIGIPVVQVLVPGLQANSISWRSGRIDLPTEACLMPT